MGVMEELTEVVHKLNRKIDNLPVQGLDPHPVKEGKFDNKEGLNDAEVAELLGVSKSTVRKHLDYIPHTYLGNRLIFPKTAVLNWLKENAMENVNNSDRMEVEGAIIRKLSS